MQEPFFSIIVPLYNNEQYITECITSVTTQSYNDYELLVIDDGSTDASTTIVSELAERDSRIVLFSKPNGGVASARNYGINRATGHYLIFLDSDDFMMPNALVQLDSALGGVNCDMAIFGSYSEYYQKQHHINRMFSDCHFQNGTNTFETKVLCQNLSSMCIATYRRSFLLSNNLYVKDFTIAEDTDFFFSSLCRAKEVKLLDVLVFAYRSNPSSVTHNLSFKNTLDALSICHMHIKELKSNSNFDIDYDKALTFFCNKYVQFIFQLRKVQQIDEAMVESTLHDIYPILLKYCRIKERVVILLSKTFGIRGIARFLSMLRK